MASNPQIELLSIKKILDNKNPELLVSISPDYYNNGEIKKLFLIIRKFYAEHSKFITFDLLRSMVAKACTTAEKTKFMMSILDQISGKDVDVLTDEILLAEMIEFHKFRVVLSKSADLINAVERKDIDATLGTLRDMYNKVFMESTRGSGTEEADTENMLGSKLKFEFRTTGFKEIDQIGGLILGGLGLLAAPTKVGKSALLGMIASHQYLHEKGSIAYFSLEMSKEEVMSRIIAGYADIELGDLMSDELTPEDAIKLRKAQTTFHYDETPEVLAFVDEHKDLADDEYYTLAKQTLKHRENRLLIFDDRCHWDDLFAKMSLIVTTMGVKTCIVDSPNLVSRGQSESALASWEYNLSMNKKLKTFSHQHKLNILAAHQLDAGKKNEEARIRFVTNAIQDSDITLFVTEEDDDKVLQTVTVTFRAIRSFRAPKGGPSYPPPFKLQKCLNKGKFLPMEAF